MCNTNFSDERLFTEDISEKGMSPDDKQWYIECQLLKIEEMKAQALLDQAEVQRVCEEARLQEAVNENLKLEALKPKNEVEFIFTCVCGQTFEFKGDAEASVSLSDDFRSNHSACT